MKYKQLGSRHFDAVAMFFVRARCSRVAYTKRVTSLQTLVGLADICSAQEGFGTAIEKLWACSLATQIDRLTYHQTNRLVFSVRVFDIFCIFGFVTMRKGHVITNDLPPRL